MKKDKRWVQERLRDIKGHAIEQTEFYRNFRSQDVFPVV